MQCTDRSLANHSTSLVSTQLPLPLLNHTTTWHHQLNIRDHLKKVHEGLILRHINADGLYGPYEDGRTLEDIADQI
jgi:hypothetical protein